MKKLPQPRTGNFMGMPILPTTQGPTWLEGEMMCSDYGQFRRRGYVRHSVSKVLVLVRCDISDTFFSIPATTEREHGYVCGDNGEYEFRAHTEQTETPAQYRASIKRAYK